MPRLSGRMVPCFAYRTQPLDWLLRSLPDMHTIGCPWGVGKGFYIADNPHDSEISKLDSNALL